MESGGPCPEAQQLVVPLEARHGSAGRRGGRAHGLPLMCAINALVCGVEIVSSAAFTYIPPLLLKAGYTETIMTIILGVAPFLDMVTVPLLAEWSDRCTSTLGRRRPFIMVLTTILIFSLILIPHGSTISSLLLGDNSVRTNMVILAVGVILLDYSYQALFNPCESLLSDLMATASEAEQTQGFTVYSAAISLGCILGYLIVSIDWSWAGLFLGTQEQVAFSVIFILFMPCLFLTLFYAQEKPYKRLRSKIVLEDLEVGSPKVGVVEGAKEAEGTLMLDLRGEEAALLRDHPSDGGYESGSSESEEASTSPIVLSSSEMLRWRYQRLLRSLQRLPRITFQRFINSVLRTVWKLGLIIICLPYQVLKLPLGTWRRVAEAPCVLRRLFFSELFGWMAIMCHNMFFTDFVGQYMYRGLPDAPEHTQPAILYDEGVRMGSWGLFLHSLTACLYAFLIQPHMVRMLGHRAVFLGGLLVFTVCMAATIVSPSVGFLNVVTALSGVGFAALTTTPNMLVTLYNADRQLYMWDVSQPDGGDEERGLGTDVAVLDTAYFLSQIVLSVSMGPLVDLTASALPYMVVASLTGAVSIYCGLGVVFTQAHLKQLRIGEF